MICPTKYKTMSLIDTKGIKLTDVLKYDKLKFNHFNRSLNKNCTIFTRKYCDNIIMIDNKVLINFIKKTRSYYHETGFFINEYQEISEYLNIKYSHLFQENSSYLIQINNICVEQIIFNVKDLLEVLIQSKTVIIEEIISINLYHWSTEWNNNTFRIFVNQNTITGISQIDTTKIVYSKLEIENIVNKLNIVVQYFLKSIGPFSKYFDNIANYYNKSYSLDYSLDMNDFIIFNVLNSVNSLLFDNNEINDNIRNIIEFRYIN